MGPRSAQFIVVIMVTVALLAACAPSVPTAAPGQATPAAADASKPAAATKACPKYGGTLRVGLRADVKSMDPHWNSVGGDADVTYNLYNSILKNGVDFSPQPDLATSWESPDPKTFIFHLRQGVKFHDGTPFNAEAVKYNLDRIMGLVESPVLPRAKQQFKDAVASVTTTDESTVRFDMKAPSPWLLATLGDYLEFIGSPTGFKNAKGDMTRQPVGTGPFTLVEKVDDDHITLKRNPDYWEKDENGCQLPFLDGIYYKILPDETVRLTNIKSGTLDFMTQVPSKDVDSLRKEQTLKFTEGPSVALLVLGVNTSKPPFDDINCRNGLAYGVDREALLRTVWFNAGTVARNAISPAFGWAYDPQAFAYSPDLAKAKEALDKCATKPLKFAHNTRNQPQFVQLAEAIQAQLKKVGIESTLDVGAQDAQQAEVQKGNYILETSRDSGRADPGVTLADKYGCDETGKPGPANDGRYCDQKLYDMLKQVNSELDIAKRKQLLRDTADYINQLALRIYVLSDIETALMRPDYDGYVIYGHGKQRFHTVHLTK